MIKRKQKYKKCYEKFLVPIPLFPRIAWGGVILEFLG